MDEKELTADVRTRLLTSGLRELEEHGLCDFSLRRVAQRAQVSCAAPYRHFKDKDELILAIISHVREGWGLLAENISDAYPDPAERVVQICVNAVRFWVANGNLRSFLTTSLDGEEGEAKRREMSLFDAPIVHSVEEFAREKSRSDTPRLVLSVLSLVYGSVALALCGTDCDAVTSALSSSLASMLN